MNQPILSAFFRKYGALLLHGLVVLWYFGSINVHWQADWLDASAHEKTVMPLSALIIPLGFYLNAFWLVPLYLKKKRWLTYGAVVLLSGLTLETIRAFFFIQLKTQPTFSAFQQAFLGKKHLLDPFFLSMLISTAFVFAKDWIVNLRLIEQLKAEKLAAELAYLKSQVDPHFLFNTLNSLYALALEEKGMNTADGIAKLGTLMRYNLHHAQADRISLDKELDFIQKYIDLQRLRTTDLNSIDFVTKLEGDPQHVEIAPMLLIPLIENAFKYGISPSESTFIRMAVHLEDNNLKVDVVNSIISNAESRKGTGLGLSNVEKRLALLYPDHHSLRYQKEGRQFVAKLEINLAP